jgi:hypothetical protein
VNTVLVEFIYCRVLNLLVLGASVSEHVHTAAPCYLVLRQIVFFVSTDSVFIASNEFTFILQVVMFWVIPRAMRFVGGRRIGIKFRFGCVKGSKNSALRESFGVLSIKLHLPFFFALLDTLFSVDCGQRYVRLFIWENEIWDCPFLPTFVKHWLLPDLEQIGLL